VIVATKNKKQSDFSKDLFSDKEYNIYLLFHQITSVMTRAWANELCIIGTSPKQVAVLLVIQALGERATLTSISKRLGRQPNTILEQIDRMQKASLIKKVKAPNGRITKIALTKKGSELYNESISNRRNLHMMFSSLSEDELNNLDLYLRTIRNNINRAEGEVGAYP
jgi:DNA-binding MarR family transcriptional regulator